MSPEMGDYCRFLIKLKDEMDDAPLNIDELQEVLSLQWLAVVYPPGHTKDMPQHALRRLQRQKEVQAL